MCITPIISGCNSSAFNYSSFQIDDNSCIEAIEGTDSLFVEFLMQMCKISEKSSAIGLYDSTDELFSVCIIDDGSYIEIIEGGTQIHLEYNEMQM